MDNSEDIELHELETIEQNLNVDAASTRDARAAYGASASAVAGSGVVAQSASGFMVI